MNLSGSFYIDGNSIFHKMNPILKVLMLVLWIITVFMHLDIRMSLFLLVLGSLLLYFSELPYKLIRNLFLVVTGFSFTNIIFIIAISPQYGTILAGHKTFLFNLLGYNIYVESIMYLIVISLKYLSLLPAAIIFIFTTHPSKFACGLNRIGLPYKVAYTLGLILRYAPEVYRAFKIIIKAQAARGVTYGKGESSFLRRFENLFVTIVTLISTALKRIDEITIAMELRNFGKKRVRTWYNGVYFTGADAISLVIMTIIFVLLVYLRCNFWNGFNYILF